MRAGKKFTLFIFNEDMNDIIKIIKSLEDSGVLIGGVTEAVKHELKKQEDGFLRAFLVPLAAPIVEPVISPVVKGIHGRGVGRVGRGCRVRGVGRGVRRVGRGYINKNLEVTNYFN